MLNSAAPNVRSETWQQLASLIDHTLLKPEATQDQVLKLCAEAAQYRFACAMVNPAWVALAHSALAGTGIPVGTVVGFPLGASLATTKREESATLLKLGAHDLDMVINIGQLKSGNNAAVLADIRGVVEIAHDAGAIVKVILEMCLLGPEEKLRAAQLAVTAGADFLKTSTGFSTSGATSADVALLRGVASPSIGVKAAGGIRSLVDAQGMIAAGANRIGASASVQIIRELGAP
jgi:deoxyribose-phosphate aldolase